MGCVVRAIVALVVLASLLAVVAAAQNRTFANAFDRTAATGAVIAGTDAALSAVGAATARAVGWGWPHLAALPWDSVPHVMGQLMRGLTTWVGTTAASLTRTDSGEPLGAGRVTAYAAGWILVILVVAWLALRRLVRWSRGV